MADRLYGVPGNWNLRGCNNPDCGLSWLDPFPLEEDIPLIYKDYYTHSAGASAQSFLARLRSFCYQGYLAISWIPSTLFGLTKARRQILNMFLEDLKPGNVLDVGCGNGDFLRRMHSQGWSGTGIDLDPKAIENAKARFGADLTFFHTTLMNGGFPENSFDAVTINHVIEHVPDSVALVKEAWRILKPGGRLVIVTPNLQSFGHARFQDCWWGLDSPRHLQVFSLNALQNCARKAGFNVVRIGSSAARADTFIGGSFGFLQAKQTAERFGGFRIQFNFLRGLRSLFLQYRESLLLRRNPACGEEALLICHK